MPQPTTLQIPPRTEKTFSDRLGLALAKRRAKFAARTTTESAASLDGVSSFEGEAFDELGEILSTSDDVERNRQAIELFQILKHAAQFRNSVEGVSQLHYLEQLQFASLLPLYLHNDSNAGGSRFREACLLAAESVAFLEIHEVLDNQLLVFIESDNRTSIHPRAILEQCFSIDLSSVARHCSKHASRLEAEVDDKTRCSYWQVAESLFSTNNHLRIPLGMSVGKVDWSRIRDHWARLNSRLLRPSSKKEVQPNSVISELRTENSIESLVDSTCKQVESAVSKHEFIEIRSANDPRLAETLNILLDQCKQLAWPIGLAVFQKVDQVSCTNRSNAGEDGSLENWQDLILSAIQKTSSGATSRGFLSDCGDLAIVFEQLDRTEVTNLARQILQEVEASIQPRSKLVEAAKLRLVAGIACAESPNRRFKIEQLIDAAWRCLSAAKTQGLGSVKSIEVF